MRNGSSMGNNGFKTDYSGMSSSKKKESRGNERSFCLPDGRQRLQHTRAKRRARLLVTIIIESSATGSPGNILTFFKFYPLRK